MPDRIFTICHKVYLNETNAMGGVVYFSNFVKWQGLVREDFLTQTVAAWPALLEFTKSGELNMITVEEYSRFIDHVYFGDVIKIDIHAFDIKRLSFKIQFNMTSQNTSKAVYSGWQKLAFHDKAGKLIPVPAPLMESVLDYSPTQEIEKFKSSYSNQSAEAIPG